MTIIQLFRRDLETSVLTVSTDPMLATLTDQVRTFLLSYGQDPFREAIRKPAMVEFSQQYAPNFKYYAPQMFGQAHHSLIDVKLPTLLTSAPYQDEGGTSRSVRVKMLEVDLDPANISVVEDEELVARLQGKTDKILAPVILQVIIPFRITHWYHDNPPLLGCLLLWFVPSYARETKPHSAQYQPAIVQSHEVVWSETSQAWLDNFQDSVEYGAVLVRLLESAGVKNPFQGGDMSGNSK